MSQPERLAAPSRAVAGIRVENLCMRYGSAWALRDVSLEAPPGGITAVIGPSGCGKSSLLRALNRLSDLIPGCETRGRVQIGDTDVMDTRTDLQQLRRRVGMIFQKPNPFPVSIRRNIALALGERAPRARDELDAEVERVLRAVGLWSELCDRLDGPAQALSGGQQQRLCIARALVLDPEVVLLDEPCSALDPISSATVEDLISELAGQRTVVIVTHNLAQAQRIADEVAFFWVRDGSGVLVESGRAADVFKAPRDRLTRAYLNGVRG